MSPFFCVNAESFFLTVSSRMSAIRTKELERLLAANCRSRIVLKRNHARYYMIVYDAAGNPLIHYGSNGKAKEYRHAAQALEWLLRKFGISDVSIEQGAR